MATATAPRRLVLDVIKRASEALRDARAQPDDDEASLALRAACDSVGISPQEFDDAVRADPELQLLQETALREALAGSTDPGPHDAISRESRSGQPGDLTKSRTNSQP